MAVDSTVFGDPNIDPTSEESLRNAVHGARILIARARNILVGVSVHAEHEHPALTKLATEIFDDLEMYERRLLSAEKASKDWW